MFRIDARSITGRAPRRTQPASFIRQETDMTTIQQIMTRGVELIQRDDTIQHAAQRMRALDVGSLPVADGKALAGMVTDRDITVRGVASGMIPQEALVSDVMTEEVRWCQETDTVEQVLAQMGDAQVRRLAVLNEAREVVGIVALGDLATRQSGDTDEALREISSPDQ
jgi:CBS-domain-containing membrane protein